MTCIVGVRTENGVVLAGDSVGSDRRINTHRSDTKTFNLGPQVALGFTSSYRMGQILRWHVDIDPLVDAMRRYTDMWDWVGKLFIPAARSAMKDHGFATVSNGNESGGTFLLAVRDRLFLVDADFQVGEPSNGYDACGSGDSVALGALHAIIGSRDIELGEARSAATRAIAAASDLTPYVGGTITYVETTKPS